MRKANVAILGILFLVFVAVVVRLVYEWNRQTQIGKEKQVYSQIGQIGVLLEEYYQTHNEYPPSLSELTDEGNISALLINPFTQKPAKILTAGEKPSLGSVMYIPWYCKKCKRIIATDLIVYCRVKATKAREVEGGEITLYGDTSIECYLEYVGSWRCWRQFTGNRKCKHEDSVEMFRR
jgi:hypothetical protein